MKDLYRRNNLESGESNAVKIHGIENGFEEDREAAFSIFLNQARKDVYDNTHRTLKSIGRLRTTFNLNTVDWKNNNSDYVALTQKPIIRHQSTEKNEPVFQNKKSFNEGTTFNTNKKSTSKIKNENVHSTFNSNRDNSASSDSKSQNLQVLLQKFAWICGVSFFVVIVWLMFFGRDSGMEAEAPKKQYKYAANRIVNVYRKPSLSETIVASLKKYEDVTVNPVKSKGEWDFVNIGEKGAYVLREELTFGSGEKKLLEDCRMDGVARPESSELLLYRPTGIHKLIISNPPGKDALLKMKSSHGKTAFFAYIRGGENFIVENIAEGDYYFEFSIGDNYGPSCGIFLDETYVVRDEEPKYFNSRLDGFKQYPKTITYVLKSEIFNTKRIPMQNF